MAVVHFDAVGAPAGFNERRGRHVCGARLYDGVHSARCDRVRLEPLTRCVRFCFDSRRFRIYMALQYMASPVPDRELKKGSAELMILALLENRPRHGYEIAQLIELRSRGAIRFNVASLYPLLYRLEKRNWIRGRWVERPGQRRRRYYRLTASGKNVLSKQRAGWREFVEAINLITGIQHA
jgi:PadR family transcriptional regulator PadR